MRIDGERLDFEEGGFHAATLEMLPAIGQGAIALQTRSEDAPLVAAINHEPTWLAVRAERELMRLLQGDYTLPVGVATAHLEGRKMRMQVILFSDFGEPPRQAELIGSDSAPEALASAAFQALAGASR